MFTNTIEKSDSSIELLSKKYTHKKVTHELLSYE